MLPLSFCFIFFKVRRDDDSGIPFLVPLAIYANTCIKYEIRYYILRTYAKPKHSKPSS